MNLDKLCGFEHFCLDILRRHQDGFGNKDAENSHRHITLKVEFKDGSSREVCLDMTEKQEDNIAGVKIIGNKPAR